ncbi:MAG: nucleotidyltransferase family protein [Planctomycetes bacterium]|nr:nucleotidyltransferase family protein [Planctomycetota bacterium]
MVEFSLTGEALWNRMEQAVEKVTRRLRKTVEILERAGVPYAVVGGHAVGAWVAQVDEAAVRTTRDVDILIRPGDFPLLVEVLSAAGFLHRQTAGLDMFVETPDASARDAVHVLFCGRKVRPGDFEPNPDIEPNTQAKEFHTVALDVLIRMKLNSFRDKDRVYLRDMIAVGLIDATWLDRFPETLRMRLQQLFDDPGG